MMLEWWVYMITVVSVYTEGIGSQTSGRYKNLVQSHSCVWLFVTLWIAAHQASLSFATSRSLLKLKSIESVMPSNHLILYHYLLILPSIIPSIRVLSNESVLCVRWPKYWNFGISPSSEHLGLISIMDWLTGWLVQSPCSPRDSQESSPIPRFKSINSLVLNFLYSPTLTSILEKAMAPHSSTFAWKISWMEEPGRLQSMELLKVGYDWASSCQI